jgi:hypothetical protein
MTGPEDSQDTRPISVAELLAKNGTIGSPPVGRRRRRRRGNTSAVTVAELTGEIPVLRDDEHVDEHIEDEAPVEPEEPHGNGGAAAVPEPDPEPLHIPPERADAPTVHRGRESRPERSHYPRPLRRRDREAYPASGAEQMSPDPVDVDEELDEDIPLDVVAAAAKERDAAADDTAFLQSYLRSSNGPLFGGETLADDLARRDAGVAEDAEPDIATVGEDESSRDGAHVDEELEEYEEPSRTTMLLRGGLIVLQSILAVAFGAGLFIAFDQLWKWNNIVALVLSVLVILGLVVGVRVVRKTEDIGSTLIAVAVGALVTLGPLALLQSN